jgi:hypothetical protein
MFRKNEGHRQQSHFSGAPLLPETLRAAVEQSGQLEPLGVAGGGRAKSL